MRKSQGFDVEHLEPPPQPVPLVRPMIKTCCCLRLSRPTSGLYSKHTEFFMSLKTLDRSSLLMETNLAKVLSSTTMDWEPRPGKDRVKTFKRKTEHDDNDDDDDDPFAYEKLHVSGR
ncbi:hypothetical protein Tsubulata_042398, partial [Turnera subulata]